MPWKAQGLWQAQLCNEVSRCYSKAASCKLHQKQQRPGPDSLDSLSSDSGWSCAVSTPFQSNSLQWLTQHQSYLCTGRAKQLARVWPSTWLWLWLLLRQPFQVFYLVIQISTVVNNSKYTYAARCQHAYSQWVEIDEGWMLKALTYHVHCYLDWQGMNPCADFADFDLDIMMQMCQNE